jgi:hypothetical protein
MRGAIGSGSLLLRVPCPGRACQMCAARGVGAAGAGREADRVFFGARYAAGPTGQARGQRTSRSAAALLLLSAAVAVAAMLPGSPRQQQRLTANRLTGWSPKQPQSQLGVEVLELKPGKNFASGPSGATGESKE